MTTNPALGAIHPLNITQRTPHIYASHQTPLFGQVFTPQAAQIKHVGLSKKVFETLEKPSLKRWVSEEANWLNMSANDWLSRIMTFLLYISQGVTSVKKDQHKWETNGRNIVIWTGTFFINNLVKSDKFGVNSLLNTFMRPKGTPYQHLNNDLEQTKEYRKDVAEEITKKLKANAPLEKSTAKDLVKKQKLLKSLSIKEVRLEQKLGELIKTQGNKEAAQKFTGNVYHRLLNKIRLEQNYYDILKNKELGIRLSKADYRKTYWASMNYIDLETVLDRVERLKAQKKVGKLVGDEAKELKTLSRFMTQLSTFKLIGTGIMSALTIYLIGTVLMNFVFKHIAPIDKDFNPEKTPQAIKRKIKEEKLRAEGKLPPETIQDHTTHAPHNEQSPFRLPITPRFGNSQRAAQTGGLL
jgi:hypothetical protein